MRQYGILSIRDKEGAKIETQKRILNKTEIKLANGTQNMVYLVQEIRQHKQNRKG